MEVVGDVCTNLPEVGVETIAKGDVASVVYPHWRLQKGRVAHTPENLPKHVHPVREKRVRGGIVGKVIVVFMDELPGAEPPRDQFWCLVIVPGEGLAGTQPRQSRRIKLLEAELSYKTPEIIRS